VSVVSVSELRRALRNQTRDVEIMRCIGRMRSPSVSNIAEELGIDRKSVRYHLYKLKGEDCVKDRWIRVKTLLGTKILCHEWQLTEKGERLPREGGLVFPVFRHERSDLIWNPRIQSSKDEPSLLLMTGGVRNSEANYRRAARAADFLHAFSLTQRARSSPRRRQEAHDR